MKIGIFGAGQLAQMMAQAGQDLNLSFVFLSPDEDACARHYGTHLIGDYKDKQACERLIAQADVLTYENENLPYELLHSLEKTCVLRPSSEGLRVSGDRLREKDYLNSVGIPTAPYADISEQADLQKAADSIGFPALLKTRRGGYDGKGQARVQSVPELQEAWRELGGRPCILEGMVKFEREISVIAARNTKGEIASYPVSENHHQDGILRLSLVTPGDPKQAEAENLIERVLSDLDYVGVLTLELFESEGRLIANEMAPRVHNSGHWSIETDAASQFRNHLLAITGQALGATAINSRVAMINLIGDIPDLNSITDIPNLNIHQYGKAPRRGRKLGHITLVESADSEHEFDIDLRKVLLNVGIQHPDLPF